MSNRKDVIRRIVIRRFLGAAKTGKTSAKWLVNQAEQTAADDDTKESQNPEKVTIDYGTVSFRYNKKEEIRKSGAEGSVPKKNTWEFHRKKYMDSLRRKQLQKNYAHRHSEVSGQPYTQLSSHWKAPEWTGSIGKRLEEATAKAVSSFASFVKMQPQQAVVLAGLASAIALIVFAMGAVSAVLASPMGILFTEETEDASSIRIPAIVQETNSAFEQSIQDVIAAHPYCEEISMVYNYPPGYTWTSYWPEILALFAVDTSFSSQDGVITIDSSKKAQIQSVFWEMHHITSWVEVIEIPPEMIIPPKADTSDADDWSNLDDVEEPLPTYRFVLHISISSKTVNQLAAAKGFTTDQMDILNQLLSAEMRPTLAAMTSGSSVTRAGLSWPFGQQYPISSPYGIRADPITGATAYHKGIDIAAPEGTPILAAADGTISVANGTDEWGGGYGYHIGINHGNGLETMYAHCQSICVAINQQVQAGEIIGYVGSSGKSTGPHLHFEVLENGAAVQP